MNKLVCILLSVAIALLCTTSCPVRNGSTGDVSGTENNQTSKSAPHVVIFAGEHLRLPIDAAIARFGEKSKVTIGVTYGSTKKLTERILAGARCDIFIPDRDGALDKLVEAKTISESNVKPLFLERLAVIVHRGENAPAVLEGQNVIEFVRSAKRIGIVDPESLYSFSGVCAMQAIKQLNPTIKNDGIVKLPDSKAVYLYLNKNAVDAAIVFNSEYAANGAVSLVGHIPQDSFNPYPYPLIVMPDATSQTEIVVRFLTSDEADLLYNDSGYQSRKGYTSKANEDDSARISGQKSL